MEKTAAELEAEKQAGGGDPDANLDPTAGKSGGNEDGKGKSREEIVAELAEKFKDATPEELLAKLAEKEEIISHKNRAIESEKKKNIATKKEDVIPPKADDDLDKPLTKRELLNFQNSQKVGELVNSLTQDETEKNAILNAYEKDIVKSGDVQADIKKALAIANSGVVEEYRKNRIESDARESQMARFSGGQSYGFGQNNASENNAVKQAAAENLRKTGTSEDKIKEILKKI